MLKRSFLAGLLSLPIVAAAKAAVQNPIGVYSEPRPEKRTMIQVLLDKGLPADFPIDGRSPGTLKVVVNDRTVAEVPVSFTVQTTSQGEVSGILVPMVYTLTLPGPRYGRDVRAVLTGHAADHGIIAEVDVTEFER